MIQWLLRTRIWRNVNNNIGKYKEFCITSFAGLFTGVVIGIFFSLTIDAKFNRWINLLSPEIGAFVVYLIGTLFLAYLFYWVGYFLTWLIDKRKIMTFHLSYISGVYCAIVSFLLVLYYINFKTDLLIGLVGVIFYFVVAHFAVKRRRPRRNVEKN